MSRQNCFSAHDQFFLKSPGLPVLVFSYIILLMMPMASVTFWEKL